MSHYTSSYALRRSRAAMSTTVRKNQNRVSFSRNLTGLGPISNGIILALILSLLGLLYLTQITKQTRYGYQISDLESKKAQLISEQESLAVESARLQSLERIENSQVASELREAASVEFIQ